MNNKVFIIQQNSMNRSILKKIQHKNTVYQKNHSVRYAAFSITVVPQSLKKNVNICIGLISLLPCTKYC